MEGWFHGVGCDVSSLMKEKCVCLSLPSCFLLKILLCWNALSGAVAATLGQ